LGADQIVDGRVAGAHFGQHVLGGDAAIHDPDAAGFAEARLDFFQEAAQGGFVRGVAGHDLVGQREALGSDDKRDDDLHAVGAFVARVAELAFVAGREGRVALEVGAGQIVEQHVEFDPEEVFPTPAQEGEEVVLVLQEQVVAAVEGVFGGDAEVLIKQAAHGAAIKPMAVEPPFAAGLQKPIATEQLEDMFPIGAFARGAEALAPEGVEFELLPQLGEEPAGPPLARVVDFHAVEADLDAVGRTAGKRTLVAEELELAGLAEGFVEDFDGADPLLLLAVVDFAEVEDGFLEDATALAAAVFHNRPVEVLLAVLPSFGMPQEHASRL